MKELEEKIVQADSLEILEKVRVELFGKKGVLAAEFAKMKDVPGPEKKAFAEGLNKNKTALQESFDAHYEVLKAEEIERLLKDEEIDVSLYGTLAQKGALHPVMETMDKIIDYFVAMNFAVETGRWLKMTFITLKHSTYQSIIPHVICKIHFILKMVGFCVRIRHPYRYARCLRRNLLFV